MIETLKQLGRYSDAELMAAVIGGIFAIFFTHGVDDDTGDDLGAEDYASTLGQRRAEQEELAAWREGLNAIGMNDMYGMIADLPPRTRATSITPARPNTAFDAFVQSLVRQIGSSLGIPAEVLLLNFTSSYSASRGALLEAWKLFKYWRQWWVTNFCQPIYEEWLQEAEGDWELTGGDWELNHRQRVKEEIMRTEAGFSTKESEGESVESNSEERE